MNVVTYTLIGLSIAAALLAAGTAIAIKSSERRARREADARLKALATALTQDDALLEVGGKQSIERSENRESVDEDKLVVETLDRWDERELDGWTGVLSDLRLAQSMLRAIDQVKRRASDDGTVPLRDVYARLTGDEERQAERRIRARMSAEEGWAPREGRIELPPETADEARYIALRTLVLSLLDDLPIDPVFVDPRLTRRLDEILGAFPPAPSERIAPVG